MKKYYLFIALAMVAGMTVSCKNNKKAEADAEVVEAAKTILADDVLATLDEIAKPFIDDAGKVEAQQIIAVNLTDKEKLVKPDYLLDPNEASNFVTKSQKLNALAVLLIERTIREAYGMPVDETEDVIAHLVVDLNFPISFDNMDKMSISERAAETYKQYKERNDLASFWQFQFALVSESAYLVSRNPDIFFRNITEEQFAIYNNRVFSCNSAVRELAKYDEEVAAAFKVFEENRYVGTREEAMELYSSLTSAKQTIIDSKDLIAARRAALLK